VAGDCFEVRRLALGGLSVGLAVGLFYFMSEPAFADTLENYPDSPLFLGGGFDPATPLETYNSCIVYDDVVPLGGAGAYGTQVTTSVVRDRQELYKKLHISTHLEGHYSFFSAKGDLRVLRDRHGGAKTGLGTVTPSAKLPPSDDVGTPIHPVRFAEGHR
jgi:hypothetical protein